uniref:Uncharacterized protein n=1 Tax=Rhizophora mucronata TaxID=61149 RepID=A0A2P2IJ16_RHIMU
MEFCMRGTNMSTQNHVMCFYVCIHDNILEMCERSAKMMHYKRIRFCLSLDLYKSLFVC